jgi:6-pyruvoyl-tetrahydropterin synthase
MKTEMFVKQLTVIDFTIYTGKLLRGESTSLNVFIEGMQDNGGIILDFGKVKPALKEICDREVDHKLICDRKYVRLENGIGFGEFHSEYGTIESTAPISMYCLLDSVSDDYLLSITRHLKSLFEKRFPNYHFDIFLHRNKDADFCYNHGLKLHEGNCQRIIHGHSSEIEIEIDGVFNEATKKWLSRYLNDKYFYNIEDLRSLDKKNRYIIAYRASQGSFSVTIPKELVEPINGEPSIENISKHVSELVGAKNGPLQSLYVRVTEGIAKGAVTRSGACVQH